ncbi:MAG: tripartite tricarboxylate transporter substrate-binding protein, partial [Burkholderiales bacterium]
YRSLPYDPLKDFAPVSLVVSTPHMLVVHPSVGVKSVRELIAAAQAKPGAINYASAGSGTAAHIAAELFKAGARVDLTHVPYKGVSGALNDTVAGTVGVMFPAPLLALAQVKAGKLIALAVTSRERSTLLPDLPTLSESGLTGYEFGSWYGLLAPRDTPPAIVRQLQGSAKQALGTKEILARLALDAAEPVGSTPEEFRKYMAEEIDRYAKLVKQLGLKAE